MSKNTTQTLLPTVGLIFSLGAASASAQTHEDLYFDVSLRGTGSSTIHADVYGNPEAGHGQLTILAVHGLTERGSMYGPLATAIFADNNLKNRVERIIAIDLPGRGLSTVSLPAPLKYGNLLIGDNASVVIQAIDALAAQGLAPNWAMGHSMGALAIQVAQEQLLTQSSSLAAHGIERATLLAAVPARGTVWTRIPGPDVSAFIRVDPVLGQVFDVPVAFCGGSGFRTLGGTIAPGAPSPATCTANGWMSIEPLTSLLELNGSFCQGHPDSASSLGLCRPFVRANAFAPENGTRLMVLGFSEDSLTPIVDQDELYTYLTGISENGPYLYRPTVAPDAVHSMFISNPSEVVSAIRNGTP